MNQHKKEEERLENIYNETSTNLKGRWGVLETTVKQFRNLSFIIFTLMIAMIHCCCLAIALMPGLTVYSIVTAIYPESIFLKAISIAFGFFLFQISLILVVPLCNFLLFNPFRTGLKHYRGGWYSLKVMPWYLHNSLVYLVRYTVLDLMTPSPFTMLFYRLMGMKIGKGVVINTTRISDPYLIEIDDYVTIGGSATIFAHYGMKGFLIIEKVHIKRGAIVGLGATIMGDTTIGEHSTLLPHSVVLPKSRVPAKSMVKSLFEPSSSRPTEAVEN